MYHFYFGHICLVFKNFSGRFIIEYVGEVIDAEEMIRRGRRLLFSKYDYWEKKNGRHQLFSRPKKDFLGFQVW